MSNVVIVAIPEQDDWVWKISSEKVPHLTILFLGEATENSTMTKISEFVEHAATTMLEPFWLEVSERSELGDDKADVVFFDGSWQLPRLKSFRSALLKNDNIKTAYDSTTQFPEWQPHLTLGYPATPAKEDSRDYPGIHSVRFDRIALWYGDFEGPEFKLPRPSYYNDAMEVAMSSPGQEAVESILSHHGVKGMKWGVRREHVTNVAKSSGGAIGRAARSGSTLVKDINFETKTDDRSTIDKIFASAQSKMKAEDLPRINAKPEHVKASKLKNRLLHPLDSGTKAYRKEVKDAYISRLEEAANSMTNASGTRKYTIRDADGELPKSNTFWDVRTSAIKHAVDDDSIIVKVVMDSSGFITDLVPKNSLAQAEDFIHEVLSHHGIKGMRWGIRRKDTSSPNPAVASQKGRKLKVEGGENHPATAEAVRAAQLNRVVKKSGTHALTNEELQAVATRMNLEQQVSRLNASNKSESAGKAFVKDQLKNKKNQKVAAGWLIKTAAKTAAKAAVAA